MAETIQKPKAAGTMPKDNTGLFARVENILTQRKNIILYVCLALSALFALLLFDARLSFATDDATYIGNAMAFLKHGTYPTFQGALYPMFLALIIKLFGGSVVSLKVFSIVFVVAQIFFLYKAFSGRVPSVIMLAILFIASVNSYMLAYGSSTFSEAMYMFLQALSLYVFFLLIDNLEKNPSLSHTWKYWLMFGIMFLLLSMTKSVAVFAIIGVLIYFLSRKEWLNAVYALVSFLLIKVAYDTIAKAIYGNISGQQTELLLRIDFHDPSKGYLFTMHPFNIDFSAIFDRFYENFANYISIHSYKMLGLRGSGVPSLFTLEKQMELQHPMEPNAFFSILFIALFVLAIYFAFKNNTYIFYTVLYTSTLMGVTFAALHTFWNQDRLMVIYLPFIFAIFCYGIFEWIRKKNNTFLQPVFLILMAICLLIQFGFTFSNTSKHSRFIKNYERGNYFYGYPPAISNFVQVCDWNAKNLPPDAVIACGKKDEAAAVGRSLQYVRLPGNLPQNADSLLSILKKYKVTHVIYDGTQMSAVPMIVQVIYQKYPQKLEEIHREGEDEEAAAILKIHY